MSSAENTTRSIPVLLIVWRRPNIFRKLIEAIRDLKPCNIYIACDGARKDRSGELIRVNETRTIAETEIDWECEVRYRYSDINQGCRNGVSNAISWFFNHVDKGIILEDDCIPSRDFFRFCEVMLNRYEYDYRVWSIAGYNYEGETIGCLDSYYFSKIPVIWGWATWSNRWMKYDVNIANWPHIKESNVMEKLFSNYDERIYWTSVWNSIYHLNKPDTWDYQWTLACLLNSGLNIIPSVNLVQNIGCNEDASHGQRVIAREAGSLPCIIHPQYVIQDKKTDRRSFKNVFAGRTWRFPWIYYRMAKYIIGRLVGKAD